MGLVNGVAPEGKLAESLADLTGTLLEKSAAASRVSKGLVNKGGRTDLPSGLEMEILAVKEHFRSADLREGVAAFAQKRQPAFGGR